MKRLTHLVVAALLGLPLVGVVIVSATPAYAGGCPASQSWTQSEGAGTFNNGVVKLFVGGDYEFSTWQADSGHSISCAVVQTTSGTYTFGPGDAGKQTNPGEKITSVTVGADSAPPPTTAPPTTQPPPPPTTAPPVTHPPTTKPAVVTTKPPATTPTTSAPGTTSDPTTVAPSTTTDPPTTAAPTTTTTLAAVAIGSTGNHGGGGHGSWLWLWLTCLLLFLLLLLGLVFRRLRHRTA